MPTLKVLTSDSNVCVFLDFECGLLTNIFYDAFSSNSRTIEVTEDTGDIVEDFVFKTLDNPLDM